MSLFDKMTAIFEAPKSPVKHYKDDFYKHDKNQIEQWQGATDMIWVLRDCGTHLIPLDCGQETRESGTAVLDTFASDGKEFALYRLNGKAERITPITEPEARNLIASKSKYDLNGSQIMRFGKVVASVGIKMTTPFAEMPKALVSVEVGGDVDEAEYPVVRILAGRAVTKKTSSLFTGIEKLDLLRDGVVLWSSDTWRNEMLDALAKKKTIAVGDMEDLDRRGRCQVAEELFDKCDEEARKALSEDVHANVRDAAKIAGRALESAALPAPRM